MQCWKFTCALLTSLSKIMELLTHSSINLCHSNNSSLWRLQILVGMVDNWKWEVWILECSLLLKKRMHAQLYFQKIFLLNGQWLILTSRFISTCVAQYDLSIEFHTYFVLKCMLSYCMTRLNSKDMKTLVFWFESSSILNWRSFIKITCPDDINTKSINFL